MVENQLVRRGIRDERVLEAMRCVPRHRFVPEHALEEAYADRALPTLNGQTISQPYIVAKMTELLAVEPGMKVLEVGTGSGYQTAILARMADSGVTIEREADLAEHARAKEELIDQAYQRLLEGRARDQPTAEGGPPHPEKRPE